MNLWKEVLHYLGNERGAIGSSPYARYGGLSPREREMKRRAAEEYKRGPVSAVPEATAAMQETQRRAAEDRARALAEIRMGQQQALGAMQPWQQQIQALQAAPEAIGAREEAGIYAAGRLPVEAQAQALARRQQYQYAPGGFRQSMMRQAQQATTGQLGELRRRTALERVLRRRQEMMGLMGQQAGYGQAAAGIYGQTGRSLAQLYGQTISAVPQYPSYGAIPQFQSPYPYQQG